MLKLVQIEFCKLRRKRLIWLMLPAACVMPFFAALYFSYFGEKGVEPAMFFKWSAFGFTLFIILPFVLGLLGVILMHDENRYDMLKQLWIVPVNKTAYFLGKFCVVLVYSICFMLITALASVLFGAGSGYVVFEASDVLFLLERCLEIAVLTAFATLPVLAAAASRKGYVLPVCITLLYAAAAFLITPVNSLLHPVSCVSVIISRNGTIPGTMLPDTDVLSALVCIFVWGILSVLLAGMRPGRGR